MMEGHNQIRAFVERIESIQNDIDERNADKSDIYKEAKSHGFDVAALKAVIAKRRKDPNKLAELTAIIETYEAALSGMQVATRARAESAA